MAGTATRSRRRYWEAPSPRSGEVPAGDEGRRSHPRPRRPGRPGVKVGAMIAARRARSLPCRYGPGGVDPRGTVRDRRRPTTRRVGAADTAVANLGGRKGGARSILLLDRCKRWRAGSIHLVYNVPVLISSLPLRIGESLRQFSGWTLSQRLPLPSSLPNRSSLLNHCSALRILLG